MFYTFWLGNVLYTTTACNFSSFIWPVGSAPAFYLSILLKIWFLNFLWLYKLTGTFGRNLQFSRKFEDFGIPETYKFSRILALRDFDSTARFSRNLLLREFTSIFFLFCTGYSLVSNKFNLFCYFFRYFIGFIFYWYAEVLILDFFLKIFINNIV